eukprot:5549497-Amphidinium_carterae.1
MQRRFNGAHCSYFHRWFQHPVWRLGQARLGNGPYTLAGSFGEPATTNFATVDSSFLPDRPSRQAYMKYLELLNDWEKKIEIPPNTPRALGGPAYGFKWDESVVREGFKSLTGITPNMLEWIVETAIEEASEYPHPMQNVSLLLADQKDKYGRTTRKGQYDMLFSYTSGEEYAHKTVHFWFESTR